MNAQQRNELTTYCFGNEIEYLQQLGKDLNKDATVVMLGVGPAIMALALLEGAENNFSLYGVDYKDFNGIAHLVEEGFEGRMLCLQGLSWAPVITDQFEQESVDLLIVDASHDGISVCRDIEAWWKKVKVGGIVFFHDYIPLEEDNGVKYAINTHKTLFWEELDRPGISIVFRKIA